MSTNERDTHFANAAKLLIEQMKQLDGVYIELFDFGDGHENLQAFVSQFFYDLVVHAVSAYDPASSLQWVKDHICAIPDMTAWPESE